MERLDLSQLPTYDATQTELLNRSIAHFSDVGTLSQSVSKWLQQPAQLRFAGLLPERFTPAQGLSYSITKFGVRESAMLHLDRLLVRSLLRAAGRESEPTEFDRGFVVVALADILDDAIEAGLTPVEIAASTPRFSDNARFVSAQFEIVSNKSNVSYGVATIATTETWWHHVLNRAPRPRMDLEKWEDLEVVARILLGKLRIKKEVFSNLETGDALLPFHGLTTDQLSADGSGFLCVGESAAVCALSIDGTQWVCEINGPLKSKKMDESTTDEWADAEVEVEIVVGETRLPIRELGTIAPGYVISLDQPVGTHVSLMSGGREIGRGELVNVEGRLGVRVVSVNHP